MAVSIARLSLAAQSDESALHATAGKKPLCEGLKG